MAMAESAHDIEREVSEGQDDGLEQRYFVHKQDIYSFIILYTPVTKMRQGHYYSSRLSMAFLYMSVVGLMQVVFSYLIGVAIMNHNGDFIRTLIVKDVPGKYDWMDIQAPEDFKKLTAVAGADLLNKNKDSYQCCRGADCSSSGLRCCTPKEVKQRHLSIVNEKLEKKNKELESELEHLKGGHKKHATSFLQKKRGGKGGGFSASGGGGKKGALCHDSGDGKMHCEQPSFHYTMEWNRLDLDGDGIWTMAEAKYDMNNLGCEYGVSAEDVFRSVCRGISADEVMHHPEMNATNVSESDASKRGLKRHGVTKQDFKDWVALSVVCSAADESRCGELLTLGVFDGALPKSDSGDAVKSLDGAIDYCQSMLRSNGRCDKMLPVTFTMHRHRSLDKCGSRNYLNGDRYTNPYDEEDVSRVMEVDYSRVNMYKKASSPQHILFLSLVLMIWYLKLLGEFGYLSELVAFIWNFPVSSHEDPLRIRPIFEELKASLTAFRLPQISKNCLDTLKPKDVPDPIAFYSMSIPHKIVCMLICILRILIATWLFFAGTILCTSTFTYMLLLINGVTLSMIFDLPVFFYVFLIPDAMKNELEVQMKPVPYTAGRPHWLISAIFSRSVAGLTVVPLMVLLAVAHHQYFAVRPALEALNCLCFQDGPRCAAHEVMSAAWWNKFWG